VTRDLDAVAAAVAAAGGAWWGGVRPHAAWLLPIGVVGLVGAVRVPAGRRWPVVVLAVFALAAGLGARAARGLALPTSVHGVGGISGAVAGDPSVTAWSANVVVRTDRWTADGARPIGLHRRLLVDAAPDERSRFAALGAGDRIAVRGRIVPLAGWATRYRVRHVAASLTDAHLVGLAGPDAPALRLSERVRDAVLRGTTGLPARERGLLAAFLLGDTRGIPPDAVDRFRRAGMSHLLVVSGANVAAVLALLGPALRRLPISARVLVAAPALAVFGAATRWEPSVLRAVAMAIAVLVAAAVGRPASAFRTLALATVALLLLDPFLARSLGFGLSVGATAGIAVLARPIAARIPGPRGPASALAVTAAAQVGVAPVLIPTFGSIPAVALPANLLAGPLVVPVTVWGLVAGAATTLLGPQAARVVQWPSLLALRAIDAVARIASRHPGALDARALAGIGAIACGVAGARVVARGRR
jgi:competence protein ComEC